jgi:hypothetical protein
VHHESEHHVDVFVSCGGGGVVVEHEGEGHGCGGADEPAVG